jgi:hypothetical protein
MDLLLLYLLWALLVMGWIAGVPLDEREAPTQQEEQDDRAQITKPLHHAPHCSSP